MAFTLTPNLKLRIDSTASADAKYNLNRIDSLAAVYQVDSTETAYVRSQQDVIIQPNSPDVGGNGTGGVVNIGTSNQPVADFALNANSATFASGLTLEDQAVGGNTKLTFSYKTDINGSADMSEVARTLSFDTDGASPNLVFGADLTITGNSLILNMPTPTSWTLPSDSGSNGEVLTTNGLGGLSWTAATSGSLAGLSDTNIASPTNNQVLTYNGSEWTNQAPVTVQQTVATWSNADGITKTINHGFGTRNVMIQIIDTADSYRTVEIDETTRPTDNTVFLSAASAPSSAWSVLITTVS